MRALSYFFSEATSLVSAAVSREPVGAGAMTGLLVGCEAPR